MSVSNLAFRSSNDGRRAEVVVSSTTKGELVRVTQAGDLVTLSVFGGEARTIVDMSVVRESARQATLPESERTSFAAQRGVREEGDEQAFPRFTVSPEARALPWLSRALGARGFTGRQAPAALPLHYLALRIADDVQEYPTPLVPGDSTPITPGDRTSSVNGGGTVTPSTPGCFDLRSDPYGDNALGMCGPGRTCWQWVCGDCCCHDGCRAHDRSCRRCSWYRPWQCILCFTGISFLFGTCGENCQDRDFAEPRVIENGGICGGPIPAEDAKCAGEHQTTTESYAAPRQWRCLPAEPGVHRCQIYDPCRGLGGCRLTLCRARQGCEAQYSGLASQADPAMRAVFDAELAACYDSAEWSYRDCMDRQYCQNQPYNCQIP